MNLRLTLSFLLLSMAFLLIAFYMVQKAGTPPETNNDTGTIVEIVAM